MKIRKAKADAPVWIPQLNEMCEFNSPGYGWVRCRITKIGTVIPGTDNLPSVHANGFYDIEAEINGRLQPYSSVRSQNLREGKAPASKKDQIVKLLKTGDGHKALVMAAKFQDLGEHRDAITKGANAYKNPDFYRQIKQDPDALIGAGVAALRERYLEA